MAQTQTRRTYTESGAVQAAREALAAHAAAKPGPYASRWQSRLDELVAQILNREEFQYDPGADSLFQQYQDRYVNLGQRAMLDTLGQSAALTGGYGNSHAQLAAQQAYGTYLQGLYDQLPELYALALDRYDRQGQQLLDQYDLMRGQESGDYSRYQSALSDWSQERSYLTGRLDEQQDFDYGAHRDAVADDQWQLNYDEQVRQFNVKNPTATGLSGASGGSGSGGGSGRGSRNHTWIEPKSLKRKSPGKAPQ